MSFWKKLFGKGARVDRSTGPSGQQVKQPDLPGPFLPSKPDAHPESRNNPTQTEIATPRPQEICERNIRIFISSTFKDMHREREILVKQVFPELRHICAERFVTLTDIDLRWGITEQQAERGTVLPICFGEIENCRPYFIGLLGERYGWVPENIPDELVEVEPWLEEHRKSSVTELEILYGALNEPEMASRSFFYFRDPAYLECIPTDQLADMQFEGPLAATRLASLKERIRAAKLPVRVFTDPEAVAPMILDDLRRVIDSEFPVGSAPDPLDRMAIEHEAFAVGRAKGYVTRQEDFERMDTHAAGDTLPLVVLGESGIGKSALLANWALDYRYTHPNEVVLMHFVGSTPQSADWTVMLRRILSEFKRSFDIPNAVPNEPEALRVAFIEWLHLVAARSRLILIIDGLNQLEDRDGAPDLVWLPEMVPPNIRLIVSTLPGRSLEELQKRSWPSFTVEGLRLSERKRIIAKYLVQFRKSLDDQRLTRITSANQTESPLFLRALLDELRVFGIHEQLDSRIDHYLTARNASDLYALVLERLEGDFERERPGLVKDAMTLLWAARRGLTESELLELLGSPENPLPRSIWSPLYLALQESLVSRTGLLSFFHEYLRNAVRSRYLPDENMEQKAHLHLADYFVAQEPNTRRVDELPWQLEQAREWERLHTLLSDLSFLHEIRKAAPDESRRYWTLANTHGPFTIIQAYAPVLDTPEQYPYVDVAELASLLFETGHPRHALRLGEYLLQRCEKDWGYGDTLDVYDRISSFLYQFGDLDKSLYYLKRIEGLCRQGNRPQEKIFLASSLHNQGVLLSKGGDPAGALKLFAESTEIYRELKYPEDLRRNLGSEGVARWRIGDLVGAMECYHQEERILRTYGASNALQNCLGNQALVLRDLGRLGEALALHTKEEQICRDLGNLAALQASLSNQVILHRRIGDLHTALSKIEEAEQICRKLEHKPGLAATLGNKANVLVSLGQFQAALPLIEEAISLFCKLDDKAGRQSAENVRAIVMNQMLTSQSIAAAEPALPSPEAPSRFWNSVRNLCLNHIRSNVAQLKDGKWQHMDWAEERFVKLTGSALLDPVLEQAHLCLADSTNTGRVVVEPVVCSDGWYITLSVFPSARDQDFLTACPGGTVEDLVVEARAEFRKIEYWENLDFAHWMLLLDEGRKDGSVHIHTVWSLARIAEWLRGGPPADKLSISPLAPMLMPLDLLCSDPRQLLGDLLDMDPSILKGVVCATSNAQPATGPPPQRVFDGVSLFKQAVAYHQQGRLKDAIALYNNAISLDATDGAYFYNRGLAYQELDDYEHALADLNRAVGLNPTDPQYLYMRSSIFQSLRKTWEAYADIKKAIELASDDLNMLYARAAIQMKLDMEQEAITDLDRVIAGLPDHAKAYACRSIAFRRLGNTARADADKVYALRLDPSLQYKLNGWL